MLSAGPVPAQRWGLGPRQVAAFSLCGIPLHQQCWGPSSSHFWQRRSPGLLWLPIQLLLPRLVPVVLQPGAAAAGGCCRVTSEAPGTGGACFGEGELWDGAGQQSPAMWILLLKLGSSFTAHLRLLQSPGICSCKLCVC